MSSKIGGSRATFPSLVALALYNAAWSGAAAFWMSRAIIGAIRARPNRRAAEKLGDYPSNDEKNICWIHACSVGETGVALRCIEALRARRPELTFAITTVTQEGHTLAAARAHLPDRTLWFPLDSPRAMRRAYERLHPRFVLLVEAEIWPNHLRQAAVQGIPAFVVNGRLGPRDAHNYGRVGGFMRPIFASTRIVCAQTDQDAVRFSSLGARRVEVTGNMKYDTPSGVVPERVCPSRVFLGASTHDGEEEIVLRIAQQLRREMPDLRLILAPRHTARSPKVRHLARSYDWETTYSSEQNARARCVVIDEVGLLPRFYAEADVAFVGKSLVARGGQNFLEAVQAGCPAVFGPHMENFAQDAALFVSAGAAIQVASEDALAATVRSLLSAPERRSEIAGRATSILQAHQGATTRTCDIVLSELGLA